MNRISRLPIRSLSPALLLVAAVAFTGCDRHDADDHALPDLRVGSPSDAPVVPALRDPSVPDASTVAAITGDPPTARDDASTAPKGALTAAEEKSGMPEALHGNNHSSPALDGASAASAPSGG